jgi:outer membrane immunogenic protein
VNTFRATLLLLAGLAGAAPVQAADMAVTPAQRVEQSFSWTGFYIGGHGGYGWGRDRHTESSVPAASIVLPEIKAQGWLFGGHAGYNWQYGMWVGGLEIDMSATGIKGTVSGSATSTFATIPPTSTINTLSHSLAFDYLATARARVGITFMQHFLLYGTGGLAWARVNQDFGQTTLQTGPFGTSATFTSSAPSTLLGAAVGIGGEASLGGLGLANVLLRIEYLHYDFGRQASNSSVFTAGNATTTSATSNGRLTADVVRGGLSVKF